MLATQRLRVIINCEWKAKGDRVYFLNTLLCHSRAAPELPALWHASPGEVTNGNLDFETVTSITSILIGRKTPAAAGTVMNASRR